MTAEDAASAPASDLVTKASIRSKIWDHLEKNDLVNYPRPVTNRIPNFKGAAEAGDQAATLDIFKKAQTIKINPDKPQEQCRFKVLEMDKRLLVPTPRLRAGLFNKITPPEDANKEILRTCSTSQGIKEYSAPISLEDKLQVDLVIVGSVAVTKEGYRIGKGEGYADMEFGMMSAMGAVTADTIIVTTVHDDQIVDFPASLREDHDITVDFIVTPTQIITCPKRPKPTGIIWSKITLEKIRRVPILRKLREMEREAGKDVSIYEDIHGEPEREEGAEGRGGRGRRYMRRRPRFGGRGGGGRGRGRRSEDGEELSEGADQDYDSERPERGGPRRRGRGGRFRGGGRGGRRGPRGESTGEEDERGERGEEGEEGEDGERGQGRRFRRRRGGRRRTTETDGDGEEVAENGEGGEGRPPNRRRRRRRSDTGPRDSGEEDGDERRRRPRKRGPALFVGSLPRRLRVSEFKSQVRGKDVNPMRVIWRGNLGHAFLQFDVEKEMEDALDKLQGLHIGGRDLRVEMANSGSGLPDEGGRGSERGGGGSERGGGGSERGGGADHSGPESGDE